MARVTLSESEFQNSKAAMSESEVNKNQQFTHAAKLEVSPVTPHTVLKRLSQPT